MTPGARESTGDAALPGRVRRRPSESNQLLRPSGGLVVALALLLLVGIAVAPQAPAAITSAITEGVALVYFNWKLDVVQPPLVSPADHCSSESPCWLSTSAALTVANAPKSSESHKLLVRYTAGKGGSGACPEAEGQDRRIVNHDQSSLITDALLFVLWMIDPACYDFYYVRDQQVVVVHPPSDWSAPRIPKFQAEGGAGHDDDAWLPPGVRREELGMLYRRNALRLLVVARVAHRLAFEHAQGALPDAEVVRGEPVWYLMPAVHTPVRQAIAVLGDAELLARFDELIVGLCICEVMRGATSCGASHLVQGVAAAVWCVPGCMDGCGWMREFLRKVQSRK